jgi:hypothetical protein
MNESEIIRALSRVSYGLNKREEGSRIESVFYTRGPVNPLPVCYDYLSGLSHKGFFEHR